MKLYQYAIVSVCLDRERRFSSACTHANAAECRAQRYPCPPGNPKVLADYQPWFGDPDHINVGYNSQDPNVLRKQIENARNMGIYAFVVDWYGPRRPFLDRSTALLERIASEQHFHIALMYDETQDDNGHATDDAMEAMDLAYQKYIGPSAPGRDAYLTYQGRPVIFVFPKRGHTDWNQVRQQVNQWESPPILIYEDDPPAAVRQSISMASTRGCIPDARVGLRTDRRGAKITWVISTPRCEPNIRMRLRWAECGRASTTPKLPGA